MQRTSVNIGNMFARRKLLQTCVLLVLTPGCKNRLAQVGESPDPPPQITLARRFERANRSRPNWEVIRYTFQGAGSLLLRLDRRVFVQHKLVSAAEETYWTDESRSNLHLYSLSVVNRVLEWEEHFDLTTAPAIGGSYFIDGSYLVLRVTFQPGIMDPDVAVRYARGMRSASEASDWRLTERLGRQWVLVFNRNWDQPSASFRRSSLENAPVLNSKMPTTQEEMRRLGQKWLSEEPELGEAFPALPGILSPKINVDGT